jgi:hypothetical protein
MTALLDTSTVIVGATGSGKTVTAKDDVQQLLEERRHVVVIDPTGVWWGMRSNAVGDGPGFDIPIFGGEHGDMPILPDQGGAIARIVLEQRVSAIVDLKAIDNSRDWRRFMHEFVAELRRGVKGNFHLVVDEADEFAAERPVDDVGFALRENLIWIAKRGRSQGFVPTWITQRTAEIAKAVISQAQTIVAHQLIAPSDLKAIDDYLKGHGSPDTRKAVMTSLPELAIGERWIYSPRLKILDRGFTPPLATFDSSRTPGPGEQLLEPRTLAQLDVSAIRAALAPPASAEPESQKSGKPERDDRDTHIARLEVENADMRAELAELREVDRAFDRVTSGLIAIDGLVAAVQGGQPWPDLQALHAKLHSHDANLQVEGASRAADPVTPPPVDAPERVPPKRKAKSGDAPPADGVATPLNATARDLAALFRAIATDGMAWNDALLISGRRPNSGDSRLARKGLLDGGLIEVRDGQVFATPELLDRGAFGFAQWPSADELVDLWSAKLRGPGGDMLREIFANGPGDNAELGRRLGKSPTSGWWRQGRRDLLRSNVVREREGKLHLHPFLERDA